MPSPSYRRDFPGGASGKEPACQCRRHKRCRFDPWVGKIPWRRAWQATPVFLPGKSPWAKGPGGLHSIGLQRVGHDWSDLACNTLYRKDHWGPQIDVIFYKSHSYQWMANSKQPRLTVQGTRFSETSMQKQPGRSLNPSSTSYYLNDVEKERTYEVFLICKVEIVPSFQNVDR